MSCNPIYPDESIQLIGVVFCGGKSSRMGADKALLIKNNKTWAQLAADKIEALSFPVCFSINKDQYEEFSTFLPEDLLVIDSVDVHGPLAGLLSVHSAFPYHDLFILACDLTDIPASLLERLYLEFRNREGEHDFFVYSNNGNYEPLLGIYTREGLQKLADIFTLNQMEKQSMKHVLEIGNTFSLMLSETEYKYFANYNSPEDLKIIPKTT